MIGGGGANNDSGRRSFCWFAGCDGGIIIVGTFYTGGVSFNSGANNPNDYRNYGSFLNKIPMATGIIMIIPVDSGQYCLVSRDTPLHKIVGNTRNIIFLSQNIMATSNEIN